MGAVIFKSRSTMLARWTDEPRSGDGIELTGRLRPLKGRRAPPHGRQTALRSRNCTRPSGNPADVWPGRCNASDLDAKAGTVAVWQLTSSVGETDIGLILFPHFAPESDRRPSCRRRIWDGTR